MEKEINAKDLKGIADKISSSKKYKAVYRKTIERVAVDCLQKYGQKQAEKKTKNILHQIWGSYYEARPDFKKLLEKIKERAGGGERVENIFISLFFLHSSCKERKPFLEKFYKEIFSITGYPKTIVDWGCGLNPLSVFWMNLSEETEYFAFDIDKDQQNFLKELFSFFGIENKFEFGLKDILADNAGFVAEIVFMLKLLPCLEQQKKGTSLDVLKKQNCRYLVVSFPAGSLSGRKKGMADFYETWFENLIKGENWKAEKLFFEKEVVFVVKKQNGDI